MLCCIDSLTSENFQMTLKSPYNALQTLDHWLRHVCLWIVLLAPFLKKLAPKTSLQGPLWPSSKIFWLKHWATYPEKWQSYKDWPVLVEDCFWHNWEHSVMAHWFLFYHICTLPITTHLPAPHILQFLWLSQEINQQSLHMARFHFKFKSFTVNAFYTN